MSSLLIKNIRHLVTNDKDKSVLHNVNLLIRDGVIVSIGKDEPDTDESVDASAMVVYPGLINAHHHLYQVFTRNLPQVQNMELFDWLKTLYELWKNLGDKAIFYTSAVGMGELLKTGCTTCFDHHYVFPTACGADFIEMQFQAATMLGIRMHVSRGSMSLSKKDGGLPPDSVVQTTDEILRDSERVVNKYHDPSRFSMRQVALAPCSPFSVTPELMKETAALARSLGVRMHTHLAETKDEEAFVHDKYEMTPLELMQSLGWLGSDVWFAHGIYFSDGELELLAKTGTGVCHCPVSNMKLSSGVAKISKMLKLGVPVGLGVDGSASNDGSNMLEEMRVAYLLHRLHDGAQSPSGSNILSMATDGGARLLGRGDLGKLAVGMAGDLFMINADRLELAAALSDPGAFLSTVGYKGNVDYTVVNGRIVVKDGRLTMTDEEKLVYNANRCWKEFISRA
ncbi:MAG: 8-oxoguanine deaminase [Oscillospiraceae bacterium]|nr:8-oxoguanine deaminase [Oscillospiraceae bacterium]